MAMFQRLKKRDSDFDFFDRFGDPSAPSAGAVPPMIYPNVVINAATHIRVVQVLPGAFEDEIRCRLETKSLSDIAQAPDAQFSALSYTWGGFANPGSITLNDAPGFPVSRNLHCCLQRLRSMGHSQWLWIDQICINQHDKQEKSLQVPLMTNIYTQAAEVIVWLGDHSPGSQSAQSRSYQLEKIISYAMFGRKDMGLCWWHRLWVLQEYSLASKEPMVQIGSEQIPWTELCHFTSKYLEGARSILPAANSFAVLNDMIERFSAVRKTSQTDHTLLSLAWVFPQLICFDPRDKIYGLLGLLPPGMKAMIRPDYERAEVKNVFAHATYTDITYTKSLGLLSLARHNPTTAGLPSWAADFVYPQDLEHMDVPARMDFWLDLFQKPPRPWTRAAPQTDADVIYDAENTLLDIKGLGFDDILFAPPIVDTKVKDTPQITSWRKLSLAKSSWTSRFVLKREERAFRQQVLAPLESQAAYQRLLNGEDAYLSPLVYKQDDVRSILAQVLILDWLFHKAHTEDENIEDELEEEELFSGALTGYFHHLAGDSQPSKSSTSFFVTRKGFVGIGPSHARNGDLIVLPYGSRYPLLLRSDTDSAWKFMSFVHVTGIGSNQLWQMLPNLSLLERRYILK